MGYFKTWGTPLVYLLVYPCVTVFEQGEYFFQCIAYFLLILHSNMHCLNYTQCKMSINRI